MVIGGPHMAIGGLGGAKERDSCGMSTYRERCWEKYCRSRASRLRWELSPLPTIVIQPRRVSASQHIEAPPPQPKQTEHMMSAPFRYPSTCFLTSGETDRRKKT